MASFTGSQTKKSSPAFTFGALFPGAPVPGPGYIASLLHAVIKPKATVIRKSRYFIFRSLSCVNHADFLTKNFPLEKVFE